MRRFLVVGPLYPYRGGIARFAERMCDHLMARGHEVSAVTFARQYPALLFPGRTQFEESTREIAFPVERALDTINPLNWVRSARRIIDKRPDLVIFNYWMPFFGPAFGSLVRLLGRRGIRSVALVHNAVPHEKRPGDRLLGRYFLAACSGHIALSRAVEQDLRTLGVTGPIERVGHPVYDVYGDRMASGEARARLGLPVEGPVLLFFGFIRPYKGLEVLLRAMPRIADRLPGVRLVVAGECYGDEGSLRHLAEELGVGAAVDFHLRYVGNEEVALYFSAADLVVQPYLSATQSGVAQIAFHFEIPLVLTDVGGLAETVEQDHVGYVVPPGDPVALAEAVERVFTIGSRDRFREGLKAAKARHSWDHLVDAVLRLDRSTQVEGGDTDSGAAYLA